MSFVPVNDPAFVAALRAVVAASGIRNSHFMRGTPGTPARERTLKSRANRAKAIALRVPCPQHTHRHNESFKVH